MADDLREAMAEVLRLDFPDLGNDSIAISFVDAILALLKERELKIVSIAECPPYDMTRDDWWSVLADYPGAPEAESDD